MVECLRSPRRFYVQTVEILGDIHGAMKDRYTKENPTCPDRK